MIKIDAWTILPAPTNPAVWKQVRRDQPVRTGLCPIRNPAVCRSNCAGLPKEKVVTAAAPTPCEDVLASGARTANFQIRNSKFKVWVK